jgi:hypothetical protein
MYPDPALMQPRASYGLILTLVCLACAERSPALSDTTARAEPGAAAVAPVAHSAVAPLTPAPDSSPVLALDGEGLRIFLRPSGSARLVAFGETRAVVIELVSRLRQGEQPEVAENRDCRATVATWPASRLQLWFSPDAAPRFIGWSLGGGTRADSLARELTTPSGIGLGSTRAALESVYVVRVARSTLGIEFTAGGLAGLLASTSANAPIRNLWAGQVCLAR